MGSSSHRSGGGSGLRPTAVTRQLRLGEQWRFADRLETRVPGLVGYGAVEADARPVPVEFERGEHVVKPGAVRDAPSEARLAYPGEPGDGDAGQFASAGRGQPLPAAHRPGQNVVNRGADRLVD